eukprot:COSAG02_NODE_12270_length_1571_cov_1.513587_2_plen_120_part_00
MGYAKGKSMPSLLAGCTLGGTFALAGYMLQQNSGETGTAAGMRQGHDVALGASTVTVGKSSASCRLHLSGCVWRVVWAFRSETDRFGVQTNTCSGDEPTSCIIWQGHACRPRRRPRSRA